jgi:hypothetical protein
LTPAHLLEGVHILLLLCELDHELGQRLVRDVEVVLELGGHFGHQREVLQPLQLLHGCGGRCCRAR